MSAADTEFSDIIGNDVFDIRDVIQRFEALEAIQNTEEFSEEEKSELAAMTSFLDEVKGMGGDHQWASDWYPVTFIRDNYFTEYAKELASDIGAINNDMAWPLNHIDWAAAAHALKVDYATVQIDGTTYWYR